MITNQQEPQQVRQQSMAYDYNHEVEATMAHYYQDSRQGEGFVVRRGMKI